MKPARALLVALALALTSGAAARANDVVTVVERSQSGICGAFAREHLDGSMVSQLLLRRPNGACLGTDYWRAAANGVVVFRIEQLSENDVGGIGIVGPSGFTQLTYSNFDSQPTISPDGSKVAFVRFSPFDSTGEQHADIYVMNTDGSGLQKLTNSDLVVDGMPRYTQNTFPAFSPDGSSIAYYCNAFPTYWGPSCGQMYDGSSATGGLIVMNSDGSDKRMVLRYNGRSPAWSPDGTEIAFADSIEPANSTQVGVIHTDGRDLNLGYLHLVTSEGQNAAPSFDGDGSQILFWSTRLGDQNYAPFVMAPDGANQHQVPLVGFLGAVFVPSATGAHPPALVSPYGLVPGVRGVTLAAAKRKITTAGYNIGPIHHAYSRRVRPGRVVSQVPRARSEAKPHSRVSIIVSRGAKR
jgi:hypothetical protein